MEGISSEAASFAGHQRLSNLCWIYDSNRVTIEGHTDITFTEDVAARFLAYGWNVDDRRRRQRPRRRWRGRSTTFKAEHERPTLILVHSHIGYGTPVEDSPKAHGEPLGVGGRARRRSASSGWPEDAQLLRARRGLRALRRRHRRARPEARDGVGGGVRGVPRARTRSSPTRSSGCSGATCPTAGTPTIPTFPADAEGDREPRLLRPGAERGRGGGARGCSAAPPTSRRRRRPA